MRAYFFSFVFCLQSIHNCGNVFYFLKLSGSVPFFHFYLDFSPLYLFYTCRTLFYFLFFWVFFLVSQCGALAGQFGEILGPRLLWNVLSPAISINKKCHSHQQFRASRCEWGLSKRNTGQSSTSCHLPLPRVVIAEALRGMEAAASPTP